MMNFGSIFETKIIIASYDKVFYVYYLSNCFLKITKPKKYPQCFIIEL